MNQPDAKKELQKFCDPEYADYLGNVASNAQATSRAIDGWAEALEKAVTPISPASSTVAAAKAAFQAAAVGMYASGAVFSAAVAAFAATLGGGMTGYTATPPAALFVPTAVSTNHADACGEMATQLVAWLGTGTATLIGPPFTTVNWT